jgi:hypothetical protein
MTTPSPGMLWSVSVGSVGTAVLYFLSLATRRFSARLFDMDEIKIHNLDRSPIFMDRHVKQKQMKVDAAGTYLRDIGVADVEWEPIALDQSATWLKRTAGVPDVLVSAANERNVRPIIENGYPTAADLRHHGTELAGGTDPPYTA